MLQIWTQKLSSWSRITPMSCNVDYRDSCKAHKTPSRAQSSVAKNKRNSAVNRSRALVCIKNNLSNRIQMPSWYVIATSTIAPILFLTKQIPERAVFPQNPGTGYKFNELVSQSVHEGCRKFAEGHELLISERATLCFHYKKWECEKILTTQ